MKFTTAVLLCAGLLSANSVEAARVKNSPRLAPPAPQAGQVAPSPLLATMQQELDREMTILSKADPAAYFMGYTITDSNHAEVTGSNGALLSSRQDHSRWLEAQVRVGSYSSDNTHRVGNGGTEPPGSFGEPVPIEDDAGVLRRAMWRETDSQYRAAAEALIKIKTGKDVQVQDAAQSAPDFSKEQPHVSYGPHASFTLDRKPWEEKVRQYTRFFRTSPDILNSIVTFTAQAENEYQLTTEGTKLQLGQECRYRWNCLFRARPRTGMDNQSLLQFGLGRIQSRPPMTRPYWRRLR